MKRENIPPFYIGQEVVALSSKGPLIKGNKYTVTGNYCCIHCGIWNTSLKELPIESGIWACCHEEQWHDHPNLSCYSSRLAPITTNFQHIEYSKVLEKEKELIGIN